MSTLKYWIWLSAFTGMRPITRFKLLSAFGDPEKIYFADEKLLRDSMELTDAERALLLDKNLEKANAILGKCQERNIGIITLRDVSYPQRLKNIYDPPVVLYIRGRLPVIDEQAAIGVVGTRKATPYGVRMAQKISCEITHCGGLVVTGLAEGIDSEAAKGALRAGGKCVGVLGCAIDEVYPSWNGELYDDVAFCGALVSEYPPGEAPYRKSFPERNRIISGLSVGVAVIEAPAKSGALITASHALDQGREVFAVPGNADEPRSYGTNELIRNGAQLVTGGWDVLEGFSQLFPGKLSKARMAPEAGGQSKEPKKEDAPPAPAERKTPVLFKETGLGFAKLREKTDRKRIDKPNEREYIDLQGQLSGLNEKQLRILSAMDKKSMHVDDIMEKSGLSAPETLSELTILQIRGFVSQESGKRFSLNIGKR